MAQGCAKVFELLMRARRFKVLSPPQLPHVGKLMLRLRLDQAALGLPAPPMAKSSALRHDPGFFCSASVLALALWLRLNQDRDRYFPL